MLFHPAMKLIRRMRVMLLALCILFTINVVEANDDYDTMPLSQLNVLLAQNHLKRAKTKEVAIRRLRALDEGTIQVIPSVEPPKNYVVTLIDPKKQLGYRDEEAYYRGVPVDVYRNSIFPYLNGDDLFAVSQTCRYFYRPSMLVLMDRLKGCLLGCQELLKLDRAQGENKESPLRADIREGRGITPLAVRYYYKKFFQWDDRINNESSLLNRIVLMIYKHGSVDQSFICKHAMHSRGKYENEDVSKRVSVLNERVAELGYRTEFVCKPRGKFVTISLGSKALTALHKESKTCRKAINAFNDYLRDDSDFDWDSLESKLSLLHQEGLIEKEEREELTKKRVELPNEGDLLPNSDDGSTKKMKLSDSPNEYDCPACMLEICDEHASK